MKMFSKGVKRDVLNGLWARKLNTQNTLQAFRKLLVMNLMIVNMLKPLFFYPCSRQASNTLGGLSHQTLGQGETAPQHAAGLHRLAGCQEKGGCAHQSSQRLVGILAWDHLHCG